MSTDREREAGAAIIRAEIIKGWDFPLHTTPESQSGAAIDALIAAGWMPRPEPGSPEWEAMVERAARELIPDGETPSEGILERAEVMLRAALVTGDETDAIV